MLSKVVYLYYFVFCFKKHNRENQINDEYANTSQENEPNLKVVTSSDTQEIECENTSQENDMTNLEVITSSDAQVTGI